MFFASRRQKKAMQATIDLHNSLKIGDRVHTTSGLQGTIAGITDDNVDLEIAPGVVTTWMKLAVRDRIVDDSTTTMTTPTTPTLTTKPTNRPLRSSPRARTTRLTANYPAQARTLCGADELISRRPEETWHRLRRRCTLPLPDALLVLLSAYTYWCS